LKILVGAQNAGDHHIRIDGLCHQVTNGFRVFFPYLVQELRSRERSRDQIGEDRPELAFLEQCQRLALTLAVLNLPGRCDMGEQRLQPVEFNSFISDQQNPA